MWELELVNKLTSYVNGYNLSQFMEDSWLWRGETNGCFSVKSAYCGMFEQHKDSFECEILAVTWKLKVQSKIRFLPGMVFRNKILAGDNLIHRNIDVGIANYNCKFCLNALETMEHLLFRCPIITIVWNSCYG